MKENELSKCVRVCYSLFKSFITSATSPAVASATSPAVAFVATFVVRKYVQPEEVLVEDFHRLPVEARFDQRVRDWLASHARYLVGLGCAEKRGGRWLKKRKNCEQLEKKTEKETLPNM